MANPLQVTWDFLRGKDLAARLPPPGPPVAEAGPPDAEAKQFDAGPIFWPGIPPQPGPGMFKRFIPNTPATWVPGPTGNWGNQANSAVFACLNAISTSFIEPPLRVYQRVPDGGQPQVIPDHPLQLLLDRPNPVHSRGELWWWVQWAKHVAGNAYLRKVRAGDPLRGNVVELWPLSPTRCWPYTTPEDRQRGVFISFYRYEQDYVAGKYAVEDIPPENIVHFRLGLDDWDMRIGCSPLQRLLREVSSDDDCTAFTDALLANFAIPGLIVTTQDRSISREDAERIKQDVATRFGGDNRGMVGLLNNGATVQQFGFSPEQLDLRGLHRVPEERISAVMGVPAIVAGLGAGLDRATYANFAEARAMYTEAKLCPMWSQDAGSIDLQLLPDFDSDPQTFTQFDLTDVRALQEDEDKKYVRLNLGVGGRWITVNEARADVGLPPVEGGDDLQPAVPTGLGGLFGGPQLTLPPPAAAGPVQAPGALPTAGPAGPMLPAGVAPAPGAPGLASLEAHAALEQKAIALRAFPALLDAINALAEPGFRRDLDAYFREQKGRLIGNVLAQGG